MKRTPVYFLAAFIVPIFSGAILFSYEPRYDSNHPYLEVEVVRENDDRWHVEAFATIQASKDIAWETLTDYNHMSEFIPNVIMSRSTQIGGQSAVEQIGRLRLFIFSIKARALFLQEEDFLSGTISFDDIEGDFRKFDGWWKIGESPLHPGWLNLAYQAEVNPYILLPQWVVRMRVKKAVNKSVRAVLKEIQTREEEALKNGFIKPLAGLGETRLQREKKSREEILQHTK